MTQGSAGCVVGRPPRSASECSFSRAFAEFAVSEFPQRVHAALIEKTQKQRLIGHISRDATAIEAREKPQPKAKAESAAAKPKLPRRKRGEPKRPEQMKRIERQASMSSPEEMVADLPSVCDVGSKSNSKGNKQVWIGYKLHLDVADGQIPISGILTSASVHDSQVALPLATLSAQRVTSLYDLMDAGYDADGIRDHSRSLGHVPIIERVQRTEISVKMLPHEASRFRERTSVERVYSRLKDEFGGKFVRSANAVMAINVWIVGAHRRPDPQLTANFRVPRRSVRSANPAASVASEIHCVSDKPRCSPCS